MAAAKSRISFLVFSPEIRNAIYELSFAHHHDLNGESGHIVVQDINYLPDEGEPNVNVDQTVRGNHMAAPSILQISQEIRADAEAFYYGSTPFIAHVQDYDVNFVAAWLQHLGPTRCAMIKNLIIDIQCCEEEDLISSITKFTLRDNSSFLHPNFLPKEKEEEMEEGAAVGRSRTTISYVAEFLDLAKYGVPASSFKVHLEQDMEVMSDTALWCVECGESHEPDSEQFQGGVCTWCYDVDEGRRRGRRERELWIVEHADRSNVENGSGVRIILDRAAGKN